MGAEPGELRTSASAIRGAQPGRAILAPPSRSPVDMSGPSRRNALANETSPYLLQHADNPVDWQPVGAGSARSGTPRGQADTALHRLFGLPLVPRHGARVIRGRAHRAADERAVRQHQGRSRGTPRYRQDLPDRPPAPRPARWRLALDGDADPRRSGLPSSPAPTSPTHHATECRLSVRCSPAWLSFTGSAATTFAARTPRSSRRWRAWIPGPAPRPVWRR